VGRWNIFRDAEHHSRPVYENKLRHTRVFKMCWGSIPKLKLRKSESIVIIIQKPIT